MDKEQGSIAEEILKEHKKLGTVDWEYFNTDHIHPEWKRVEYVKARLEEDGLIVHLKNEITRLTSLGDRLKSYADFKRKQKWETFWKKVELMPKRYWFVGALLITQVYNVRDAAEYFLSLSKGQHKTESSQPHQQLDTTQNKNVN